MSQILHEWEDGFAYRVIGGRVPRVERGGRSGGCTAWAGLTVCNDAAVVREIAHLAAALDARDDEIERLREALAGAVELLDEIDSDHSNADRCRRDYRVLAARAALSHTPEEEE